jgi:hypothetical protein
MFICCRNESKEVKANRTIHTTLSRIVNYGSASSYFITNTSCRGMFYTEIDIVGLNVSFVYIHIYVST